jgi:hypothetical protein
MTITIPTPANVTRIRVGDELTDIYQHGQLIRDSRDSNRAARFLVTAMHANGDIELKPVHRNAT